MNRQYIGARYVPVFAEPSEWDSNRSYEPLTIVTYYGNSYTSKKSVPAGIQLDNSEYWASTGNFNAQVEAYRAEVEEYADKVDNFIDGNVIIIGDSYAVPAEGRSSTWATYLESYFGFTVAHPNEEITPETNCLDMSNNGGGFCGKEGYLSWLANMQNNYPAAYDKEKVTKIIIAGGLNDSTHTRNEIDAAIVAFKNYVAANFPNATVYLFCFGNKLTTNPNMANVYNAYAQARIYKHWIYCSGLEAMFHNTYYLVTENEQGEADYAHPNNTGSLICARTMKNLIMGGNALPLFASGTITAYNGETYKVSTNKSTSVRTGVEGLDCYLYLINTVTFSFLDASTSQATSVALALDTNTPFGTVDNSYIRTSEATRGCVVLSRLVDENDNNVIAPIRILVDKDGVMTVGMAVAGVNRNYKSFDILAHDELRQNVFVS